MKKLFALSMLIPAGDGLLLPKTGCSGRTTTRSAKGRAGYARESIRRTREGIVREGKSNGACGVASPADAQLRDLKRDGSSNVRTSATVPPGLAPPDNSQLKASREKRIEELRALRQRRMEAIQKMRSMRTQPNSAAGAPVDTSASGNTSGPADTSTSASTGAEATSPSPSSTPQ